MGSKQEIGRRGRRGGAGDGSRDRGFAIGGLSKTRVGYVRVMPKNIWCMHARFCGLLRGNRD
jgi:hypothetical protein